MENLPLFRVSFEEDMQEFEPAMVQLRLSSTRGPGGGNAPEIDTSQPFVFKVSSRATADGVSKDYLKFEEPEALPGNIVRFTVEPTRKLLGTYNFNKIVKEEFIVTITVKLKSQRQKELSGQFRVKVDSRVKIHWEWESHPLGFPDQSGKDTTVILQPDGKSWFKLKVWAMDWKPNEQKSVPSDPEAYEFSHWIAPDDKNIDTKIFAPQPLPWNLPLVNQQAENNWHSRVDLPDLPQFPRLNQLPIDTEIRVKAWHRKSIQQRLENAVKADRVEVGEVIIPVRLIKSYLLSVDVLLEGDEHSLKSYQETVTGESLDIFCPQLPKEFKARIRWKVIGPPHFFTGKRKFQKEDKITELVPVLTPSGGECLGTPQEIEIVENPCSKARDPLYLDAEAPFFEPNIELIVTKDSIKGDEKDYTTVKVKLLSTRPDGTLDKVKELKATFSVTGGKQFKADDSSLIAPRHRSPEGAETDVKADWANEDTQLTVEFEVEITLAAYSTRAPLKVKGSTIVFVIGAKPSLTLSAEPRSADADGSSIVTVTPTLRLFEETYDGILLFKAVDADTTFFATPQEEPATLEQAQILKLRCKFHLQDEFIKWQSEKGGAKISFRVVPQEHDFAKHLPEKGIEPDAPLLMRINPSLIICTAPNPASLPFQGDDKDKWKSRVSAIVQSASGQRVRGTEILRDSSLYGGFGGGVTDFKKFQWGFTFTFPAPQGEWASPVDTGGTWEQRIHEVDNQGQILFKSQDPDSAIIDIKGELSSPHSNSYLYDHWEHFYDLGTNYLKGQGCIVTAVFDACGISHPSGTISIGKRKVDSVVIRVRAQSGEVLSDATVTIRPQSGDGHTLSAKTDSDGQVTFEQIRPEGGPYLVRGSRQARLAHIKEIDVQKLGFEAIRELTIDVSKKRLHDLVLPCSTQWSLSSEVSASGKIGIGLQGLLCTVYNRATEGIKSDRERRRHFIAGGPSGGFGISLPIPSGTAPSPSDIAEMIKGINPKSDPTPFETTQPVTLDDFSGPGLVHTSFELAIGYGYAQSYIFFLFVAIRQEGIDIGSWEGGSVAIQGPGEAAVWFQPVD